MNRFRRWLGAVVVVAGCAGPAGPSPNAPESLPAPLAGREVALVIEVLPGEPPAAWPVAIAEANGRHLLPWRDPTGLHARIVDDAGAVDVALGPGAWLGAAPIGDRFAVAIAAPEGLRVHLVDGIGDQVLPVDLPGQPVPAVASDGERLLVVSADRTGAASAQGLLHAALAGGGTPLEVELGLRPPYPQVYGDREGFIVDQHLTVSSEGAVDRTPAEAVPGARLYRRHDPDGDAVTLDGASWLAAGAPVLFAVRDDAGIELILPDGGDGQRLTHVVGDLTSASAPLDVPRSPSVPGWLRALSGDRAMWEAQIESDHVFASLDRATLAPGGTFVRVPAPSSRTVSIAFSPRVALLAWIDAQGHYSYARVVAP